MSTGRLLVHIGRGRRPTAGLPVPPWPPEVVRVSATVALGQWGEDLAVAHLEATGATVLARNWRCREGELDVVAREPDGTLCFVEVKTRSGTGFGEPAEAVGPVKARRVRAVACRWLAEHRPPGRSELRFDVIAVLRPRAGPTTVRHLRGAF